MGAATSAAVADLLFARIEWALLPAYVLWTCALVALAMCDGLTQRIPTPLIRRSIVVVCLALIAGAGSAGHWTLLLAAAAWIIASAAALLLAWRFAGAGFGDVRLAVLGGVGLGFATPTSLLIGLGAWAAVTAGQAVTASARDGSLRTRVALGPGLATAFLVAACIPT
ncbi:peptidase [Klenkia sp. PcliD-1-E]|uniref:peptidase n=1 Tax=Klenkia sp. PcliD-1-E TaxID=2954492 RepID=UPI0020975FEC|nr:peptidase [Klenkia sp. PcliD-1-E]MCO7218604.1 peptidase [Klenkia sp. PcliD-1-E]